MNTTSNANPSFDSSRQSAIRYDAFLGPMFFEPYAIEVAERIPFRAVSVALELAAGTGRVTRHIRKRIPDSAHLIASDINEDMLTVAREKLAHLNIEWQTIDAQQLPFSDNSVDLIVCCFGYMSVPDKPKAFAEAYRVLRHEGLFLFTTWDKLEHNAASYISRMAAKKYCEEIMAASHNLATSMHDEAGIRVLLEDAGFLKIAIEKVQKNSVCATASEAAIGLVQNGPLFEAIKRQNPAWVDAIINTTEAELSEKFGAAPMVAPISAVISQAWK
ncbi:class I SAM-dependent methyltransferase [Niabella sp.]|uniref:class I SAM-dependent methyltransferase n=1 Tax=Niabella sp. TaxID=1962976 RepID=UPI0026259829|nr:class I SAM-dependent methyltransferase [Niabella sp.]